MIISLFTFFKNCLKKKKKAKFEEQTWAFFEINEHFVFIFPSIFFFFFFQFLLIIFKCCLFVLHWVGYCYNIV
jgi:hypothetical protein